eukprot:104851-Pelagomonas_calceolata.AAC.8
MSLLVPVKQIRHAIADAAYTAAVDAISLRTDVMFCLADEQPDAAAHVSGIKTPVVEKLSLVCVQTSYSGLLSSSVLLPI